jgi:hypothetical protein
VGQNVFRGHYSGSKKIGGTLVLAVGAVVLVLVRGDLYDFTRVEWAVTASAGVIGLLALPLLPADLRSRVVDSPATAAIGLFILLEVVGRPLHLPPQLTTPLAAFATGWLTTEGSSDGARGSPETPHIPRAIRRERRAR